jgi:hypothetical protein
MQIMSSDLFITAMTAATAVVWVTCVRPLVKNTFTAAATGAAAATGTGAQGDNAYLGEKPTTMPNLPRPQQIAVVPPPSAPAEPQKAQPQPSQRQRQTETDVMPLIPAAFGEDEFWREESPLLGGQYHVIV